VQRIFSIVISVTHNVNQRADDRFVMGRWNACRNVDSKRDRSAAGAEASESGHARIRIVGTGRAVGGMHHARRQSLWHADRAGAGQSAGAAAFGDRFVYLVRNGYWRTRRPARKYRVDSAERDHYVLAANPSAANPGQPRTSYLFDGNWVHHPFTNHNMLIDYEFNPPCPAYVFRSSATDVVAAVARAIRRRAGSRACASTRKFSAASAS
jgi:hypothetical protein